MKRGLHSVLKRLAGPAIILLAAAVALAPLLRRGPTSGSDLFFHLASWIEARNSMLMGIPYPHWTPQSNFGAGEPRFVFYPPLTWMTGAALGLVLPWGMVGSVFGFLLLAAIGLATRKLAREVLEDGPATLAGCAAIFSGYPLLTFYVRADFAELAGGFWIPLMLLFLLRDRNSSAGLWKRAFDGSAALLAITVAGVWLTNGPAGLMASYLLTAAAVTIAVVERSWAPLLRATAGTVLGMGLAADFLVPAFWEQNWANLKSAISIPHYRVEYSWLFAKHSDMSLAQGSHDQHLRLVSWVAVSMLTVTVLAALVAWKRGTLPEPRRWRILLLLIPCAVLFSMLPVSLPVWNVLPKLRYLQFPWRWLLALEAPFAILFAAAAWFKPLRWRIPVLVLCAIAFAGLSAYAGKFWFQSCGAGQEAVAQAEEAGIGVYGKREYAPPGGTPLEPRYGQPGACLIGDREAVLGLKKAGGIVWPARCGKGFKANLFWPEHKEVTGVAAQAGYLVLRLRNYPAWRATVNGQPVTPVSDFEYGLMAVPVEEGPVHVVVDWTTTPDVIAGRCTSCVSVLLLTGLWLLERKLNRPRLS
jgi:hypothetical protein